MEQEAVTQYTHPDGQRYRREQLLQRGELISSTQITLFALPVDQLFGQRGEAQ